MQYTWICHQDDKDCTCVGKHTGAHNKNCFNCNTSLKTFYLGKIVFSNIYTLINILFWCEFISAWNAFYLAAAAFPQPSKSVRPWELFFHQHVVQVQIGWGQDWLPYDTCPATLFHLLVELSGNPRRLTTSKSHCKRQSPWHRATPRAKSTASDLKADRDSKSLIFLSAGFSFLTAHRWLRE